MKDLMGSSNKDEQRDRSIIRHLAEGLVLAGIVDPKGKGPEQIRAEVRQALKSLTQNGNTRILVQIDHMHSLVRYAGHFARKGNVHLACLLYATWFEHWVNSIISVMAERREFNSEDIRHIIRETQFNGKFSWLIRLLGFPSIRKEHLSVIQYVCEVRNGFVHYKWQAEDADATDCDKKEQHLKTILSRIPASIRYLQRKQNAFFFQEKKRSLAER